MTNVFLKHSGNSIHGRTQPINPKIMHGPYSLFYVRLNIRFSLVFSIVKLKWHRKQNYFCHTFLRLVNFLHWDIIELILLKFGEFSAVLRGLESSHFYQMQEMPLTFLDMAVAIFQFDLICLIMCRNELMKITKCYSR